MKIHPLISIASLLLHPSRRVIKRSYFAYPQSFFAAMAFCQSSRYLLLLVLFSIAPPAISAASCYFPDGSPSPDIPCKASASISVCCGAGYACLDNNLCSLVDDIGVAKTRANQYIRGSCTDPTWASGRCPLFCLGTVDSTGTTEILESVSSLCNRTDHM